MMIDEFSIMGIIKGCINSNEINSPECRLLGRISEGYDVPEYKEYDPDKQYFYQMPNEEFSRGPIEPYAFVTLEDFLSYCVEQHGEYPVDFWEER